MKELAKELNYIPIVHRLLMANIYSSIDTIPKDELVMNLCDGSDIDGMPGITFIKQLTNKFNRFRSICRYPMNTRLYRTKSPFNSSSCLLGDDGVQVYRRMQFQVYKEYSDKRWNEKTLYR